MVQSTQAERKAKKITASNSRRFSKISKKRTLQAVPGGGACNVQYRMFPSDVGNDNRHGGKHSVVRLVFT